MYSPETKLANGPRRGGAHPNLSNKKLMNTPPMSGLEQVSFRAMPVSTCTNVTVLLIGGVGWQWPRGGVNVSLKVTDRMLGFFSWGYTWYAHVKEPRGYPTKGTGYWYLWYQERKSKTNLPVDRMESVDIEFWYFSSLYTIVTALYIGAIITKARGSHDREYWTFALLALGGPLCFLALPGYRSLLFLTCSLWLCYVVLGRRVDMLTMHGRAVLITGRWCGYMGAIHWHYHTNHCQSNMTDTGLFIT